MLSTEAIKNVSQAAHYFMEQDNYYLEDAEGKERSEWWGQGAKELGLSGKIDEQKFTALLRGQLPDGQQLGIIENEKIKHRPGFDLTFSVPKSVSLAALLGEDKRILEAVSRATNKALQQIENDCAQARITQEGVTTYQNTQNLAVAKFLHDISREGDPQLHIHCVVMNMTLRSDGQWRSLASKSGYYGKNATQEINGFFERVRHDKHYYGVLFRTELAYELKQLGYSLVKTGKNNFEIEGISQKTLDAYSYRRQQITSYLEEHGYSGAKAAAVATLKTRRPKNIDRDTLQELWQARSQVNQIDTFVEAKSVVERALNPSHEKIQTDLSVVDKVHANEAVKAAMDYLSETQSAIPRIELINTALRYALGEKVNLDAILNAIENQKVCGELIPLNSTRENISFTTKKLVAYEQEIVQGISKTHTHALMPPAITETFLLAQTELSAEQKQGIKTLFSSNSQIMALEGSTGTGKTYLLKPMMELAKLGGYRPILLTSSKAESIQLEQQLRTVPQNLREWFKRLFDNSQYDTVSRFLKVQGNQWSLSQKIIFVDQATALSSKQMCDLVKVTQKSNARLILLGDPNTLLPWQSGTPFTQLLQHGITKATLTHNLRVQHEHIKTALADTLKNNIISAFEKIDQRILSIENNDERLKAMAIHIASLTSEERSATRVLMPTRAQCEEMNIAIREALKQQQVLQSADFVMNALIPKSLREVEYKFAKSYSVNQWVRFNKTYVSLDIQKGEYCQIKAIHSSHNRVVLETPRGKSIHWNPARLGGQAGNIEVFDFKTREVAVGDTLVWQRHDVRHNLHKGERLTVSGIDDQKISFTRSNHKTLRLRLKDRQTHHFDYGYASTPYQKQEGHSDIIIAYQNSFSRQSHQRLFYKHLSQATQQAWIYTENKTQLLNNLQKHTGDKNTVLELLLGDKKYGDNTRYNKLLEKAICQAIHSLQQKNYMDLKATPETLAQEAVHYALAHLGEREAAFEHKEVLKVAFQHALGDVTSDQIQAAILAAENQGYLIRGVSSQQGHVFTTREALEMERDIIQLSRQDQGKLEAIAPSNTVEDYLQTTQLKLEHAKAIREIMNCQDRIMMIQGDAGTGKTTLLKTVEPLLKNAEFLLMQQNYQLLCLAPTHTAVKELVERGLTAQTVDSYLTEYHQLQSREMPLPQHQYHKIIAVDESSMLSNRRLHDLLRATQLMQDRLIFIGDKKQYPAIESGKPYTLLLSNELKVIYLTDIERQKNPELLKAVKEANRGDFATAFQTLGNRIYEIGKEKINDTIIDNRDKRLDAISEDYLSRTTNHRVQTSLITLGNDDRELLNERVRKGLQQTGELYGNAQISTILLPRDLSGVERTRSTNYKVGNIIRFNYTDKNAGIEKNQYLSVNQIDAEQNLLVLKNNDGKIIVWQPPVWMNNTSLGVEVYQARQREIQAGDLIRWTRTDKALQLINPELARVEKVEENNCLVRHVKIIPAGIVLQGEPIILDLRQSHYQHWDHAYAMTGYSAQGKSLHSVILHCESHRKFLTSQPSLIVMLTRAVHDLKIYTDDKEALLTAVLQNKGEKTSALETAGEQAVKDSLQTDAQKKNLSYSRNLVRDSQSIKNTIAEHYLREHCGITSEKMNNFRFHPGIYSKENEAIKPALLTLAKDVKGNIQGVQITFLDETTGNKADVKLPQQTWGEFSENTVMSIAPSKSLIYSTLESNIHKNEILQLKESHQLSSDTLEKVIKKFPSTSQQAITNYCQSQTELKAQSNSIGKTKLSIHEKEKQKEIEL